VTDKVGMRSPIGFHFQKKVLTINRLRFVDHRVGLFWMGTEIQSRLIISVSRVKQV
jgi:hypothetical protein